MTTVASIQPYAASDERDLIAAWNEAMWADPIDARAWRLRYLLDPYFDPASCLVARVGDAIAGFVLGMRRADSSPEDGWVVGFGVRHAWRRQGIATALFLALESTWRTSGVRKIAIGPWIPHYVTPGVDIAAYPEAVSFIASRGGEITSRPLSMKASLTGYRPPAGLDDRRRALTAAGVDVRPAGATDILPLMEFLGNEFPHWRADAAGVLRERFGGDPSTTTMHVALDRGQIAGYAQSRAERFGPFGVSDAQRGLGIGALLLASTMQAMRASGYHCAWFLWTSDRAARLYRQHGFEEVRRFALMEIDLGSEPC